MKYFYFDSDNLRSKKPAQNEDDLLGFLFSLASGGGDADEVDDDGLHKLVLLPGKLSSSVAAFPSSVSIFN